MAHPRRRVPLTYFLAAFVIAAPLGFALGFAGLTFLPAEIAPRLLDAFLVLIATGAAGILAFGLPREEKTEPSLEPPTSSNVIRFKRPAQRTPRLTSPHPSATPMGAVRRFAPRRR